MSEQRPKDTLDAIVGVFPDFKQYWGSEGDIYRDDDGSFTFHGLFAVLSHYVRERYGEMGEEKREALFRLVEACISEKQDSNGIVDAVHTCFIENLAGDLPSDEARRHMKPMTLKSFKYYDVSG